MADSGVNLPLCYTKMNFGTTFPLSDFKTLNILMKMTVPLIYLNLCLLKRALFFLMHLFKTHNMNQNEPTFNILVCKLTDSSYTTKTGIQYPESLIIQAASSKASLLGSTTTYHGSYMLLSTFPD
jgi:hypothetical protein